MSLLDNFWIAIAREAVTEWLRDKAFRLGAAVAFFSMFALAPLLLISISLAGFFFGEAEAQRELEAQLGDFVNPETADSLMDLAGQARETGHSLWATVAGIGALFFGATGVFGQLQDALNTIWGVKAKPEKSWLYMIRRRLLSSGMVVVIGFLLLVSLTLSTIMASLMKAISGYFSLPDWMMSGINNGIFFVVIAALFAVMFKVLPDAKVKMHDLWGGAVFTAGLFVVGKFLLAWYLGRESMTSTYGAAGAFVVVLMWIYYSSLILFLGAEFTQAYARRTGSAIEPKENAVKIDVVEK
jgi:membrane protein